MLSSKHISKIAIVLMAIVLVLCFLAMGFYDKLAPLLGNTSYAMEYEEVLFDTSQIIDIDIIMEDDKWQEMLENASEEKYYECDVIINGTTFKQVGIRPKGNTSLSSIAKDPDNNRYSFKLEFDQFVDGQTCFGLDKLILNNNYADATNMKEAIVYDMYQYLDAEASLYNYAKISVNDEYFGVYLALEAVEESFMLRNNGMEKGFLYKPENMEMGEKPEDGFEKPAGVPEGAPEMPEGGFERPTGAPEGAPEMPAGGFERPTGAPEGVPEGIPEMSEGRPERPEGEFKTSEGGVKMPGGVGKDSGGSNLNYTDDELDSYSTIWDGEVNDSSEGDHKRVIEALKNVHNKTNIEDYIDVEQVLKYMAVHNFVVNEDSLSGSMAHNYYLYESNGKISILPWDYNLAFGGMHGGEATSVINEPIDDSWQGTELFDFVFEDEEYKARYHEYYNQLVEEYVYGGRFEETYNRIRTQIDELVKNDPNAMFTYEEYTNATNLLYEVIMLRTESIQGQLEGIIPTTSEGQKSDTTALVDASHIDLSVLGTMMNRDRQGAGERQKTNMTSNLGNGRFTFD